MSGIKKNIVFIVMILIVLVIGVVWYSSYTKPSNTIDGLPSSGSAADAVRGAQRDKEFAALRIQILSNIAAIKSIHLNTTVLQDQAFLILERPERQSTGSLDLGRTNPFLPY